MTTNAVLAVGISRPGLTRRSRFTPATKKTGKPVTYASTAELTISPKVPDRCAGSSHQAQKMTTIASQQPDRIVTST